MIVSGRPFSVDMLSCNNFAVVVSEERNVLCGVSFVVLWKLSVSVKVKNGEGTDGAEVVNLYIADQRKCGLSALVSSCFYEKE